MENLYISEIFSTTKEKLEKAIELVNSYIAPLAQTGELIIDICGWKNQFAWEKIYHATLDEGAGKSCCAAKVNTLIKHDNYGWTGVIPESELNEQGVKWYGAIHLRNCRVIGDNWEWEGDMIISFSGRKEWQDVLYVVAVLKTLSSDFYFQLPEGIQDDPVWGTAINLCEIIFQKK